MKIFLTLNLLLLNFLVFALPKKVEIIFLSPDKKAALNLMINDKSEISSKVAQNDSNCVPMGDGCFHPQHGYIEGKSGKSLVDIESKDDKKLETKNTLEANMIECKEGDFFDIFCGKAKEINKGSVNFEVWIDTSSSLRRFDWAKEGTHCARRSFVTRLQQSCSINVMTFDTSIKQLGALDTLCLNYGLNDQDRLIRWINSSDVKHLVVVTDIDEASTKFSDYLDSIGAVIHGSGSTDFTATNLVEYVREISKTCQKKKK